MSDSIREVGFVVAQSGRVLEFHTDKGAAEEAAKKQNQTDPDVYVIAATRFSRPKD